MTNWMMIYPTEGAGTENVEKQALESDTKKDCDWLKDVSAVPDRQELNAPVVSVEQNVGS